jgi:hypothetical protein
MQLHFRLAPPSTDPHTYGIQEEATLIELSNLYPTIPARLLAGNINLRIPDLKRQTAMTIASIELKHILRKCAGQTIYICDDDPSSTKTTDETLEIP